MIWNARYLCNRSPGDAPSDSVFVSRRICRNVFASRCWGEPDAIAWRLILDLLTLIRTARSASNDRRKRRGKMTLRSIEAQIEGKLVSLKYLEFPASQAAARCVRMSLKTGKVCIALICDLSDHSFGSL